MIALIQKWRQTISMPLWNKNGQQRVKKNQCDMADKTASVCEFLFPHLRRPPIITCSNMSFMNYLPRHVIICRVFRFMSPLSAIIIFYSSVSFYESPWYRITFILCLFITDLVAFGSSAQTVSHWNCSWLMWQHTPYNRAGGCGYLNALIFTAEEGGCEGFNSVESGSSIFVPTTQWLHPPHIPHEVTPARGFMNAEALLVRAAPLIAEDLAPLGTEIEPAA